MKSLNTIIAAAMLLLAVPAASQFLPPGVPHPPNNGEDVMADHLVDGATIHLVWASNIDYTGGAGGDPDIFYIRFDGAAWSAPVLVNSNGLLDNSSGGIDENPRLALGLDGVLHCVWQNRDPPGGFSPEWDVLYSHRPVGGDWQDAEHPWSGMTADFVSDIDPNVIARSNGDPLVVWHGFFQSGGASQLLLSSIRTASGWTPRATIAPEGFGDDFGPVALARAANGTIVAAFSTERDFLAGVGTDRDIVYSLFPLSGGWTELQPAAQAAIGDSGDDRDPAVALLGSGEPGDLEIHIAWASTNDINGSGAEGDILAAVVQWPAASPPTNPAYVVNSNAVGDIHPDDKPSLCVEPAGVVHAAWQTRDAFFGDLDLLHASNATPGGAWTAFDLLSVNGLGPDGDDQGADIECGPAGILSGIWQSTDDLGGAVGSDHDLFHALGVGRLINRPEPINSDAATDSEDDMSADFGVGPDGVLHAVWDSKNPPGGNGVLDRDVFYARRDPQGWSDPQLVNATGIGDAAIDADPSIFVGADGKVQVAWSSGENIGGDTATDLDVFYSALDAGTWSTPELVNGYGRVDSNEDGLVRLAAGAQGGPQALWKRFSGTPAIYWAQRSGAGWSQAELVSGAAVPDGFAPGPCFLVDPSGVPHVVWRSASGWAGSGPDTDIFYARRTGGVWSVPELVNTWGTINDVPINFAQSCALARHANGDLQAVWNSPGIAGGAGPDSDLYTARRSAAGWSAPELLLSASATDTTYEKRPVALLAGSILHVFWDSEAIGFLEAQYAAVDLTAPLPSDALVLRPEGRSPQALAIGHDGVLHFGQHSNLGGTLGNDLDVVHAWLAVANPLIFASGFE